MSIISSAADEQLKEKLQNCVIFMLKILFKQVNTLLVLYLKFIYETQ